MIMLPVMSSPHPAFSVRSPFMMVALLEISELPPPINDIWDNTEPVPMDNPPVTTRFAPTWNCRFWYCELEKLSELKEYD